MAKPALGRGLGALLGGASPAVRPAPATAPVAIATATTAPADTSEGVRRMALDRLRPCPFQPRKDFPPEALQELAASIKEKGIVQPLIVRPLGDHFELIAGERRWRAAQLAGLTEVPVIVREADDREVLALALIENLQRENLNPIEEALGYSQLIEQFQLRQEDVAAQVGKSRVAVANALRLLRLPQDLQTQVRDARLSVGHAKVILGLGNVAEQSLAAERVMKLGLNVRQTEELVAQLQNRVPRLPGAKGRAITPLVKDAHVVAVQNKLQERLGTKVALRYREGKGALEIQFFSDDDLNRVLEILGVRLD